MALTFPRTFANLTTALLSYLDDNFNYIKNLFGAANGFASLDANSKLSQNAPLGFTINNQTAWHAGNDGTGSGLDADLIKGKALAIPSVIQNVSVGAGAEVTTNIALALSSSITAKLLVGIGHNDFAADCHKVSYKAIAQGSLANDLIYEQGGYGTLPADPAVPTANTVNVIIRNNSTATRLFSIQLYMIGV